MKKLYVYFKNSTSFASFDEKYIKPFLASNFQGGMKYTNFKEESQKN